MRAVTTPAGCGRRPGPCGDPLTGDDGSAGTPGARNRELPNRISAASSGFRTPSPFWHSSRWLLRRGP